MTANEVANQVFEQLRGNGGAHDAGCYIAIPGDGAARWLLPADGVNLGPVLATWAPYRLRSRMAWAAVRAASHIGQMSELPGTAPVEVDGASAAQWESLGWRWCGTPAPVIYLGTPGLRRKAVVHLVDRETARCRAVVKVPLTEEAKAAVRHEAEVLEALEAERYERAPRLLFVDWARSISTQTFVEGRPGARKLAAEHWRLLRSLLLAGETTSLLAHAEGWQRCAGSAAWAVEELRDGSPLPACWEHADFTPWNIRRLKDGECALLDWECARRKGLPLMDAFHFLHMQDFLFGESPRRHGTRVWEEAARMGIPARWIRRLEIAYLVGAYVECMRSGNDARGRYVHATLERFRRKAE
ncbi:MAG TPA: phosphotransferase [Candidatus Bathyarchaeia archaeon]|nr:phosphotransferase [Candidatus Bathyarchaeia archaeon]